MPSFEERERAEEARDAMKRELAFRIRAHRNKLLALWAAAKIGWSGERAQRYAADFVASEIAVHEDEAIVIRLRDDLLVQGIPVEKDEIRLHLERFGARAERKLAPTATSAARR